MKSAEGVLFMSFENIVYFALRLHDISIQAEIRSHAMKAVETKETGGLQIYQNLIDFNTPRSYFVLFT